MSAYRSAVKVMIEDGISPDSALTSNTRYLSQPHMQRNREENGVPAQEQ